MADYFDFGCACTIGGIIMGFAIGGCIGSCVMEDNIQDKVCTQLYYSLNGYKQCIGYNSTTEYIKLIKPIESRK